jgi:membrane associated rhomboid family serine protease
MRHHRYFAGFVPETAGGIVASVTVVPSPVILQGVGAGVRTERCGGGAGRRGVRRAESGSPVPIWHGEASSGLALAGRPAIGQVRTVSRQRAPVPTTREPIFNAPTVIVWTLVALLAIHVGRLLLPPQTDAWVIATFAFVPARYAPSSELYGVLPGGVGAEVWTFLTYALLHANFMHLIVNGIWLLAFGSPVAWRFGAWRFLLFAAVTAAAGAGAFLVGEFGAAAPMIGASAAISGLTAAAIRFVFHTGGPLGALRAGGAAAFRVPAVPLRQALREPQVLLFVAVWFGINLLAGISPATLAPGVGAIAWQAHLGGFVAGLLLFPLFDPVPRRH